MIGFYCHWLEDGQMAIGLGLKPELTGQGLGKGIGKNALTQFCHIVFEKYNVSKLCAFTYKNNVRSKGALESVGFRMIEEFEEDGVPSCYYELWNQ